MKLSRLQNRLSSLSDFCATKIRPLPHSESVFDLKWKGKTLEKRISDLDRTFSEEQTRLIHAFRNGTADPKTVNDLASAWRTVTAARKKFVSLGGSLRHSHASNGGGEGALSAAELLERARAQGITQLLVTQHNQLAGALALMRAIQKKRYLVQTLPSVELALTHSRYRLEFHWKVKFPDPGLVMDGVSGKSLVQGIDDETFVYADALHRIVTRFSNAADIDRWLDDRWPVLMTKARDWNLTDADTTIDEVRSRLTRIFQKRNDYIRKYPRRVPGRWLNGVNPVGTWTTRSGINHSEMRLAVLFALTAFDIDFFESAYRDGTGDPVAELTTIDGILPTLHSLGAQVELCHPMLSGLSVQELADMWMRLPRYRSTGGEWVPMVRAMELHYPTYNADKVRRGRRLLAELNTRFARLNRRKKVPFSKHSAYVFGTGSNTDFHSDFQYSPVLRMKPDDRTSYFIDAERLAGFLTDYVLGEDTTPYRKLIKLSAVFERYPFFRKRFETLTGFFKS